MEATVKTAAAVVSAMERQIGTVTAELKGMQRWFDTPPQRQRGGPVSFDGTPTYEKLGLRPLVNCKGTFTVISGSVMLPEVREAMVLASQQYVQMEELMFAASDRIAELMEAEWALVTCGCSAALMCLTATCIAGTDPAKMCQLPDSTGLKNEVIVQRDQRDDYDAAVRMVGAKLIEVSSRDELLAAIGPKTCMLLMLGDADSGGLGINATHPEISAAEMVEVGQQFGLPVVVDAAAERPDVPNPYLSAGVDAVCYSGGKCMRGPQTAGITLGKKTLLQQAFLHGSPHHAIGRPTKVGKEEIMGMVAAVEQWRLRDHVAEWAEWQRCLRLIETAALEAVATHGGHGGDVMTSSTSVPGSGKSNVAPMLDLFWEGTHNAEGGQLLPDPEQLIQQLSSGFPRIEVVPLTAVEGNIPVKSRNNVMSFKLCCLRIHSSRKLTKICPTCILWNG